MDHAIVVASGTGIDGEDLATFARTSYGGNPHLTRLLIVAQRAGIDGFTIIEDGTDPELKESIERDKRITAELRWQSPGAPLRLEPVAYLVLQSNILTTPSGLRNIIESEPAPGEVTALVDESEGALVKSKGDKAQELFYGGGRVVGVFGARGDDIERSLNGVCSIISFIAKAVEGEKLKCLGFRDGYWMRLTPDEGSAKKAEDLIFSHVSKSSSGWLSRNIHSKLSIPVSRLLVKTPLTPNMISAIIGSFGALCGLFFVIGMPLVGALILEIATVFDRCDGEVARIKLKETKYGQWIDTIFDQLSFFSLVVGMPVGYWLYSHSKLAIILGGINIAMFLFFLFWTFYFLIKHARSGTIVAYAKEVDKLIPRSSRTPLHKLIIVLRPLMKRESFSLAILVGVIIGGYPLALSQVTLGLGLMFIHQLDDVLKLTRAKRAKKAYISPQKQGIAL